MMELTIHPTTTYEVAPKTRVSRMAGLRKASQNSANLLRASAIMFGANLFVAIGIVVSPGISVSPYGALAERFQPRAENRPSPFQELVSTAKPAEVKLPEKLVPAVETPVAPEQTGTTGPIDLDSPGSY